MIIRFYGRVGEALGRQTSIEAAHGVVTVADLRRLLAERYPSAAEDLLSPTLRACIDDRVVAEDHMINDNSHVEFFPPLSGG
ncbi:MAG: MoaD/ThiS family protein [Allosphingosinicella sp.]